MQQKRKLASRFDLVDQAEVNHLLGMTINRDREYRSCKISQRSCAVSVVRKIGKEEINPVATPMEANLKLQKIDESETEKLQSSYQQAFGSLIFLMTGTRPDLSFAVSLLSQFICKPGK